eukprot:1275812-Amphidinium_carterae.1
MSWHYRQDARLMPRKGTHRSTRNCGAEGLSSLRRAGPLVATIGEDRHPQMCSRGMDPARQIISIAAMVGGINGRVLRMACDEWKRTHHGPC